MLDSSKYLEGNEVIDVNAIKSTREQGILNDPDDILFAHNNPCNIVSRNTLKEILIPSVSASGCTLPVNAWDGVKLKRGNVAGNKDSLILDILVDRPDLKEASLRALEYNHRIPVSIAKQYPEAVSVYLKDIGITDINKFGDLMNHADNVRHYWSWRDQLKDLNNVDKDTIRNIIENIEVKGLNRGIDYTNNVYR